MASQALGELDLTNADKAKTWLLAFNALSRAKGWEDDDADTASLAITDNFIAQCGLQALEKIQCIVAPNDVNKMKFSELQQKIQTYLQPNARLVIAERTRFYKTKQNMNESVTDFVARLRKEAIYCQFDKLKDSADPTEEMVKVALVAGLNDAAVTEKVLECMQTSELTVMQVQEFVQQCEQVKGFVRQQSVVASSKDDVKYEVNQSLAKPKQVQDCRFCGKNHPIHKCPAFGKVCSNCGKKNNFAAVCRAKDNVHYSAVSKNCKNVEDEIFYISDANLQIYSLNDVMIDVNIYSMSTKMQKDTGADISLISSRIWKDLGRPTLRSASRHLEAYDGHMLPTLGKFNAIVDYNGHPPRLDLTVVRSEKNFGLLGRDYLFASTINAATFARGRKFLPSIKGFTASMELLKDSPNKFCQARPVALALQQEVADELDRLERMGIMTKVKGGVENASPVVWVRKQNGKLRLCADYKVHVNQ